MTNMRASYDVSWELFWRPLGASGGHLVEEEEEEGEQKGQRSLECLSEPLGISLGRFLEASWDVWGVSWRSWGALGRLGCLGGASWGPVGGLSVTSWEDLEASWALGGL